NGKVKSVWRFTWLPCQGATKYHIYVIHSDAINPIVDEKNVAGTNYLYQNISYGITVLQGWTWKVRPYIDGKWGEWSETRPFNVTPLPCTISGNVSGTLTGEYVSDVGGEHHSIRLHKVFLVTLDGQKLKEATIQNGRFIFKNVPAGKSYRIYPDSRFVS